jgi:hypothetical protein
MSEKRVDDIFKSDPRDIKAEIKVENYIRKTIIIKSKYANLIDRKAYHEMREKKDVIDEIMEAYFKDKTIKPYPKGEK